MTDRVTAEWGRRLDEGLIRLDRGVEPEKLAERYDVEDREPIVELTNRATLAMIDAGYGHLAIEDLDEAAAEMGVSVA